jgi:hypothetical protein
MLLMGSDALIPILTKGGEVGDVFVDRRELM